MCHARRCSVVNTNGEKSPNASFGHSSRRPPPAKPQPTAKGSAIHSPLKSGGTPTFAPPAAPADVPATPPATHHASSLTTAGLVVSRHREGTSVGTQSARHAA